MPTVWRLSAHHADEGPLHPDYSAPHICHA
jgi:hypothetical protein